MSDLEFIETKLETRSLGAIVLVEKRDRVAAVTFGTGFHALEPRLIERGFGLRVTANMIADDKVRGAQTRGLASNSRDQKTLLPVDGEFNQLNVEVDEEWLRQLSGKSSDATFATTLSGSDSLRIAIPDFSLSKIGTKVDEVLAVYETDGYKNRFPFLDQIAPLDKTDPVIKALDALVVEQVRLEEEALAFASPDPFEQSDLDHFEITVGRKGRFALDDLDLSSVFQVLRKLDSKKDPLNDVRVYAMDADRSLVDRVHPLRSYIQTEVVHEGDTYLLSAGLWFLISQDFVSSVEKQTASIPDISDLLALPTWNSTELKDDSSDKTAEGSYNKLVARERNYALLDKDLVYFGPHEKMEISDLLTDQGHLLCVKKASSSATLSHLVAQAVGSAAAWGDPKYQLMLDEAWSHVKKPGQGVLERRDVTFVLAIATPKEGKLHDNLFFFTKVQIASSLKPIQRAGFKIALAKIPVDEVAVKEVPRAKKS